MTQQQPRLDVPHGCDFGFGSVEDQLSLAVEQVADDRFCGLPEPRVEDAVVFGAHRDFGSGNGVIPTWHVITVEDWFVTLVERVLVNLLREHLQRPVVEHVLTSW
jgi:hypothetical protein